MRNPLRFAVALALGATFACQANIEPAGNGGSREEALGQLCEAKLAVSGSFAPGAPQPADVFGCWPVGTWRVAASVVESSCGEGPALAAEYAFEVTRDAEETQHVRYLNDPTWDKLRLKVSSGGGGLCEGGFEIFTGDGRAVIRLKPALEADGTISGFGEYEEYRSSQL